MLAPFSNCLPTICQRGPSSRSPRSCECTHQSLPSKYSSSIFRASTPSKAGTCSSPEVSDPSLLGAGGAGPAFRACGFSRCLSKSHSKIIGSNIACRTTRIQMRNPLFSEASLGFALSRKAYHFTGLCQQFLWRERLLHECDCILITGALGSGRIECGARGTLLVQ